MKVLIVNTSDRTGGAAIAAFRLFRALRNNGVDARMLVRDKKSDDPFVTQLNGGMKLKWQFLRERLVIWLNNRFSKKNLFGVDIANTGTDITRLDLFKEADVIHLHWVNQGFLSLNDIRAIIDSGKPVVWTMHDMWAFTGICHYSGDCMKYSDCCHDCPQLQHPGKKDLSYRVFQKKYAVQYSGRRIYCVACSRWLEQQARKSSILKGMMITNIPNAIDTSVFCPADRKAMRDKLGLPQDKKLLLFGSMKVSDKRKGVDYLASACRQIWEQSPEVGKNLGVVVFGKKDDRLAQMFPFPIYEMNYINDETKLAEVYNAVDLFVTPSLQDNLPNTIVEAMSCGTPCVGFNVGGIPQMIEHLHNGYIAEYKSASDLADGIVWGITTADYDNVSHNARRYAVEIYSEGVASSRYMKVYKEALKASK
ncbi:MAG: glycosyltransferase family 4 protein [Bacteroides sp.]|nr:glycosyltransferase family 4 protein [Bacteroides sp.]MCM1390257.1 glycosyltransferase family 4 protein [Bacteroides sp.]